MRPFKNGRKTRTGVLAAGVLSLGLVTAACGGGGGGTASGGGDSGGDKTVAIGWIPWQEDIAVTYLWQEILEKRGYEVELTQLDVGPVYTALAEGDVDVFLDAWLPNTHASYWEEFGEDIDKMSAWYDNGTLELTVPSYVDADSIGDLKGMADKFNGRIVGIEPGAGITAKTQNSVMPKYGLEDYELKTSSTTAMLAALKGAVAEKKPIAVTLWHPHVAYTQYDLKDLKDPKGAYGKGEKLWVLGAKDFASTNPEVAKWLDKFHMTKAQLADLEGLIFNNPEYTEDPAKGIEKWLEDPKNQALVEKWAGPAKG